MLPLLHLSKYRCTVMPNAFICSSNVFPMPSLYTKTQGNPLACFSSKVGGRAFDFGVLNPCFLLFWYLYKSLKFDSLPRQAKLTKFGSFFFMWE